MGRRSKLELYISVLKCLSGRGLTKPTHIMYEVNICYQFLADFLAKLVDQGLVEKQGIRKNQVRYIITQKGEGVLKRFIELNQVFSKSIEDIEQKSHPTEFLEHAFR